MAPGDSTDDVHEPVADGGLYPMRLVTRLTGLSADTIRAWERRYAAIEPQRSAGNTRRFSAEDVRRLVLLRDATARGHAISSIARLSIDELERLVQASDEPAPSTALPTQARPKRPQRAAERGVIAPSTTHRDGGLRDLRAEYMDAVARFDARRAYDILMRAATFLDRRELVYELVVPLVQEVGARWAQGEFGVAQEHMMSSQLRSVVGALLRIAPPRPDAIQLIFTTPPGHRHEFGVLVAALLAATKGFDPLYLGPDLPHEELKWAARMSPAEVVVLSVARDVTPVEAEELPVFIAALSKSIEVWVGLLREHVLARSLDGIARIYHDFESFDAALDQLV